MLDGSGGAGHRHGERAAACRPGTPSILRWTLEQQTEWYPAIETVYRTATVKRGDYVRPLPKAERTLEGLTWSHGDKSWTVDDYMKAYNVSGVMVVKDGKVMLERYGLGRKPEDRWISFSVTKSITSTLVGAAIQDGKIKSVDDQVTHYIPELAGSAYDGVTVRQLLTMSSGVKWNEDYTDPNSDVARAGIDDPGAGRQPDRELHEGPCRGPTSRARSSPTTPARPIWSASWSPTPSARRCRSTPRRSCGRPTAWSATRPGWSTWRATSAAAAASP